MKRRILQLALIACAVSLTALLTSCTTIDTRIAEKQESFRSMSPTDQALVQQGKIREGMNQDAVYIAWGPPSQHIPGRYRGRIVETWIYDATAAGDYPGPFYYGYPYGYYPPAYYAPPPVYPYRTCWYPQFNGYYAC